MGLAENGCGISTQRITPARAFRQSQNALLPCLVCKPVPVLLKCFQSDKQAGVRQHENAGARVGRGTSDGGGLEREGRHRGALAGRRGVLRAGAGRGAAPRPVPVDRRGRQGGDGLCAVLPARAAAGGGSRGHGGALHPQRRGSPGAKDGTGAGGRGVLRPRPVRAGAFGDRQRGGARDPAGGEICRRLHRNRGDPRRPRLAEHGCEKIRRALRPGGLRGLHPAHAAREAALSGRHAPDAAAQGAARRF